MQKPLHHANPATPTTEIKAHHRLNQEEIITLIDSQKKKIFSFIAIEQAYIEVYFDKTHNTYYYEKLLEKLDEIQAQVSKTNDPTKLGALDFSIVISAAIDAEQKHKEITREHEQDLEKTKQHEQENITEVLRLNTQNSPEKQVNNLFATLKILTRCDLAPIIIKRLEEEKITVTTALNNLLFAIQQKKTDSGSFDWLFARKRRAWHNTAIKQAEINLKFACNDLKVTIEGSFRAWPDKSARDEWRKVESKIRDTVPQKKLSFRDKIRNFLMVWKTENSFFSALGALFGFRKKPKMTPIVEADIELTSFPSKSSTAMLDKKLFADTPIRRAEVTLKLDNELLFEAQKVIQELILHREEDLQLSLNLLENVNKVLDELDIQHSGGGSLELGPALFQGKKAFELQVENLIEQYKELSIEQRKQLKYVIKNSHLKDDIKNSLQAEITKKYGRWEKISGRFTKSKLQLPKHFDPAAANPFLASVEKTLAELENKKITTNIDPIINRLNENIKSLLVIREASKKHDPKIHARATELIDEANNKINSLTQQIQYKSGS